jgi:exosortase
MSARSLPIALLMPVTLIGLLWVTAPTWQGVTSVWFDDGTYSHGLLLVLVCCWLLWRDWRQLRSPAANPDWRWLTPLLLISALYQLALVASIDLLQRLLLLPLLLTLVAALGGTGWAKRMLFPSLMLSLAIPLWGLLITPLQWLAVWATGGLLNWLDIPAAIHATHIRIAAGSFEVSEGCSGLRYLLVAAAITLLWGKLYLRDWRITALYLGIGILAALLTNWIRILGLILVGHHTEMQHPLMDDHNSFGWYIFAAMLIPLFWIGHQLPHAGTRTQPQLSASTASSPKPALLLILPLVALGLPALLLTSGADERLLHPPLPGEGWQLRTPEPTRWRPDFVGADQQWHLQYGHNQMSPLFLHLYWYGWQRKGTELLGQGNQTRRSQWPWQPLDSDCPPGMACGQWQDPAAGRVMMYGFMVNGTLTTSVWRAKLSQLLAPLSRRPGAALVLFERDCHHDCAEALSSLIRDSAPLRDDLWAQLDVRE